MALRLMALRLVARRLMARRLMALMPDPVLVLGAAPHRHQPPLSAVAHQLMLPPTCNDELWAGARVQSSEPPSRDAPRESLSSTCPLSAAEVAA